MSWLRIEAGKVTAAIRLADNIVVETAPVFAFMKGWTKAHVLEWCQGAGWKALFLPYE